MKNLLIALVACTGAMTAQANVSVETSNKQKIIAKTAAIVSEGLKEEHSCQLKKRFRVAIPKSQEFMVYAAAQNAMDRGMKLRIRAFDNRNCN